MAGSACAASWRARFEADQPRSGDGQATQLLAVLPRRRDPFRRLRHEGPAEEGGEEGRRAWFGRADFLTRGTVMPGDGELNAETGAGSLRHRSKKLRIEGTPSRMGDTPDDAQSAGK